ncbi:MAG: alpha/beta hydrolase [Chloroflexi bacterium]|nr:alpha/beta hydrolase [Chloroflexota bacterium]MYF81918.1 alpha/beta hydrolase [Chloroflexota bacterium]MYI05321.1 alpha/beta hydrolase [Chloroflexota bacterium]
MATFVLIHGAYQGGWIWSPVAARLRAQGHDVYAPSLDGCAERSAQVRPGITTETHAEELVELMRYEDLDDVILVGTSSGGMVLARVAERARERVRRIVFVDALALLSGETIRDIVSGAAIDDSDVATGPRPEGMLEALSASMDADLAQWAADRFGQHPAAVFNRPVELDSFWDQSWDATVIWCRQAPNPGHAHQQRCAQRLGARWHELETGHYPMLSTPDELTRLILEGER